MEYSSVSPSFSVEDSTTDFSLPSAELEPPFTDSLNSQATPTLALDAEVQPASLPVSPAAVQPSARQPGHKPELRIFLSTFFTIFLAELGDKTQVTTLLMSAESHAPWVVFAGAGTALVATSLIGVWLGAWLAQRVSPKILETSAGALLLFIAVLLLWDVVHL